MTRNGKYVSTISSVCCVMACRMWQAAGVFGNMTGKFSCPEITDYVVYALDQFGYNKDDRPAECKRMDPDAEVNTCLHIFLCAVFGIIICHVCISGL